MVLDPVGILVLTPCARRPISLALALVYSPPSTPFRSAVSSIILPVDGSTTAPAKSDASVVGLVKISVGGVPPKVASICAA